MSGQQVDKARRFLRRQPAAGRSEKLRNTVKGVKTADRSRRFLDNAVASNSHCNSNVSLVGSAGNLDGRRCEEHAGPINA